LSRRHQFHDPSRRIFFRSSIARFNVASRLFSVQGPPALFCAQPPGAGF